MELFLFYFAIFISEPIPDPDHPAMELAATFDAEDLNEGTEVCDHSDSDEGSVLEEEVTDEPPTDSNQNEINTVVGSVPSSSQEEKKSYASIVSSCPKLLSLQPLVLTFDTHLTEFHTDVEFHTDEGN